MIINSLHQPLCICKSSLSIILSSSSSSSSISLGSYYPHPFLHRNYPSRKNRDLEQCWRNSSSTFDNTRGRNRRGEGLVVCGFLPVDPWAPSTNIDSQSIASQLFSFSLFPYLGFLYFLTKSKTAPKLTLFGFYFLLAFVGATIPAGIYAKVQYGTSLANVDWLHGGAESLLTLTNLFIVMGLREALRKIEAEKEEDSNKETSIKEDKNTSV